MRVRRLTAKNFRRFASLDLEGLGDGLVVVVGPNESGKSTIGEALTLALAGPRKDWDPARLVRWEHDNAEVMALVELDGGRNVAVRRSWDRTGNYQVELHDPESSGEPLVGAEAEQKWAEYVGIDPAGLRQLIHLPQGEFEKLKRGGDSPGERWERLAGVPRLRRAADRAQEFAAGAAHRLEAARGDLRAAEALVDELGGAPEALEQARAGAADAARSAAEFAAQLESADADLATARAAREQREKLERGLRRAGDLAGAAYTDARRRRLQGDAAALATAAAAIAERLAGRRKSLAEQRAEIEAQRGALDTAERSLGEAKAAAAARARSLREEPEPAVAGGGTGRGAIFLLLTAAFGFGAYWFWMNGVPAGAADFYLNTFKLDGQQSGAATAVACGVLALAFFGLALQGFWAGARNKKRAAEAEANQAARDAEAAACEQVAAGDATALEPAKQAVRDETLRQQIEATLTAIAAAPTGDAEEVRAGFRSDEDRLAKEDAQADTEKTRAEQFRDALTAVAGEADAGDSETASAVGTVAELEGKAGALQQELNSLPEPPEGEAAPLDALRTLAEELDELGRAVCDGDTTLTELPALVDAIAAGEEGARQQLDGAVAQWTAALPPLEGLAGAEQDAARIAERTRTAQIEAEARRKMAEADCERLQPQAERAESARADAQRLGEGLAQLAGEEAVAREAADLVQATIADVIGRLRPALTSIVSLLLPRITANRYHAARVDDSLAITVKSPETGDWVPLMDLSGSAADQVLFCVRAATSQALRAVRGLGHTAMPLYLDQPLAAFDDRRSLAFLDLLRALHDETPQIFLASIRSTVVPGADHVLRTDADTPDLHWRPQATAPQPGAGTAPAVGGDVTVAPEPA